VLYLYYVELYGAALNCVVGVVLLQIEHVAAKDGKLRRLTLEEEVAKEVQQVRGGNQWFLL
jgi:hypothetical protein